MPRRTIRAYAFNEYGEVWTGPGVAQIRAAIRAEQTAALAHGDETGDYSRFRAIADTEAEIGRRLAKKEAA